MRPLKRCDEPWCRAKIWHHGSQYPPFAASLQMQSASRNEPPLGLNSRGVAVALLQGGLVQQKIPLPRSMKKGFPDGAFGLETAEGEGLFSAQIRSRPSMGLPAGPQSPFWTTYWRRRLRRCPPAAGAAAISGRPKLRDRNPRSSTGARSGCRCMELEAHPSVIRRTEGLDHRDTPAGNTGDQ
jgi:hypothetical protein